jgi:hypothetical protein
MWPEHPGLKYVADCVQREIGVLDRTDMDNFAHIFVYLQARGKSQDKDREPTFKFFVVENTKLMKQKLNC